MEWTSIYLPDKETVFAIAKNITARKLAEIEIEENYRKYKSLTTHFKKSIEKDRNYFASELHEELAQLATVIKMNLEFLYSNLPEMPEAAKQRMNHTVKTSALLIDKIRTISYNVGSNAIDDIGLNEVLHELCEEFSSLTGISCKYHCKLGETDLPHEIKLDFFRICQEALKNVMLHAQASSVTICLEHRNGHIHLSITDNGKGFEVPHNNHAFGLTGIHGRTASINGQLSVESKISKGTKISVKLAASELW